MIGGAGELWRVRRPARYSLVLALIDGCDGGFAVMVLALHACSGTGIGASASRGYVFPENRVIACRQGRLLMETDLVAIEGCRARFAVIKAGWCASACGGRLGDGCLWWRCRKYTSQC